MEREVIDNEFYDHLGECWYTDHEHPIALLRKENAVRTPWVASQISQFFQNRSCQILDIGCGAGFLANALAEKGHQVTGLDLSERSLVTAREKDQTHTVSYLQGDAYQLAFPKNSFDVICSMDFLEHVEDPQKIVSEAARVLKPGGLFFFHTFNRNWLSYLVVLKGVEWFVKNTPKNMHLYRLFVKPREMKQYCAHENIEIKKMQGLVPLKNGPFWKMLITRKVPPNFTFQFTRSLLCGYVGMGVKKN